MPRLPDTRLSLLTRLATSEDAEAWSGFVDTYEEAILRYSLSCGLQQADAAEVVQEVFLAVHQMAADWKPSGRSGGFRAWLFQTARRISLRALRNRGRSDRAAGGSTVQQALQQISWNSPDAEESERDWQRWALCWAVGQVRPACQPETWKAFWLTAMEGLPAERAADLTGLSVGSVYAARCRIQSRLRAAIEHLREGVT